MCLAWRAVSLYSKCTALKRCLALRAVRYAFYCIVLEVNLNLRPASVRSLFINVVLDRLGDLVRRLSPLMGRPGRPGRVSRVTKDESVVAALSDVRRHWVTVSLA